MWKLYHTEGWAPKNWSLRNVVLEKTLESPLDNKGLNQSIWNEIDPDYSLEGLILKLQYFGHLMRRARTLEMTLMMGKIKGRRRRGRQRMRRWLVSPILRTWIWASSRRWWRTGKTGMLQFMGLQSWTHWTTELN